ncbi:MAG: adenylyltransferase/cytidyltransferase family protein [Erythrobacter sp.]|nr:adenylyltransferase/cytidyltransferase family protein [Erythrobacter sp.]
MAADLFHYGHVEFLKNARAFGDHLLVGVNSDETVGANKRHPILNMEERIACVGGCRYVDEVAFDGWQGNLNDPIRKPVHHHRGTWR